ncbi:hypothetical protein SAY86_009531 [Trapa natans]|uniref:S-protein homolog n=1 Tax=Trapa natans TaxID=22666 RepID=A0AAN7KWX2_TRANT|nr:hypothetical protein SAY86_009531 [Trapa natans]
MMHKSKTAILLLLLLCVAAASDIGEDQSTVHVEVWNKLEAKSNIIIHCKSKDDDLGIFTVLPNQAFTFHFRRNFFASTLFFCGIYTEHAQGTYDIYKFTRDGNRCYKCTWAVKESGVYGFADGNSISDIFYKWTVVH